MCIKQMAHCWELCVYSEKQVQFSFSVKIIIGTSIFPTKQHKNTVARERKDNGAINCPAHFSAVSLSLSLSSGVSADCSPGIKKPLLV